MGEARVENVTTSLAPAAYEHWRATPLDRLTEQAELRLVFDLAGSLAGRWSAWAAKRRLQSRGKQALWSAAHFWTRSELEQRLTEAGLRVEATRGAVYFPPITVAARLMAPIDPMLARLGTLGAAFLCTAARKP